jgi:hypothetical protein
MGEWLLSRRDSTIEARHEVAWNHAAEFRIYYIFMFFYLDNFIIKSYLIGLSCRFAAHRNCRHPGAPRGNDQPTCRRKTPPGLPPEACPQVTRGGE